jgi:hypothetical protein
MKPICWLGLVAAAVPAMLGAQTGRGPYARIAVLRPLDGQTTEFEAGYIRHLGWHKQAGDPWAWYGYSIWAGRRYRWFVYATFGHSAASFDSVVNPADDERDNLVNVAPHVEWVQNELYEFLPALSRGSGEPQPTARLEYSAVDLLSGAGKAFEAALTAAQSKLTGETLWYRMVAGGDTPRYVRLRPAAGIGVALEGRPGQELPEAISKLIARTTVEIWTLRPTMSLGLGAPARP